MARRKRLEVPAGSSPVGVSEIKSMGGHMTPPPIARVAAETAAEAALAEVAGELAAARDEGRIIVRLPVDAVDMSHIIRDRLKIDPEEMATLEASIVAHGQRTPIEAVETSPGRYGLISGARRLMSLKALYARTGDVRFAEVAAILRRPVDAASAYVAMVEENEIRANLSHWERAEIVARVAEEEVFDDTEASLSALFGTVSRARRSKIRSFLALRAEIGSAVRFGPDMSERLGLALARACADDPNFGTALVQKLLDAQPATIEEEREVFSAALMEAKTVRNKNPGTSRKFTRAAQKASRERAAIRVMGQPGHVLLEGPGVDGAFRAALETFVENWRRSDG